MPSFQAKIIKKFFQLQPFGWAKGSISEQRLRQEKSTRFFKHPKEVKTKKFNINGIPAELIEANSAKEGVILYLHGGAYALGSIKVYREFLARLAVACQVKVLAIDYCLAPEHPFPAALEDAVSAYRWLLMNGFESSNIVIVGDSAGGGLALSTLVFLRDKGERLPACAVCISPWVNLAIKPESINKNNDPILNPKILEGYAGYYAGNNSPTSPLISPVYADLKGLPPLLIHVGTDEFLLNEAIQLTENARQANTEVVLQTWEGVFHGYQIIPFLPETKTSLEQIAKFISRKIHYNGQVTDLHI